MRIQTSITFTLLTILSSTSAFADPASDRFFEGIDQLSNGKFQAAGESFDKAIAASPRVAAYHLDRGVAMILLDQPDQAAQSLDQAAHLEPKNPDVKVWSYVRVLLFDPTFMSDAPPYSATPYAKSLILAAMAGGPHQQPAAQTRAKSTIQQAAKDFAWRQLSQIGGDSSADRIQAMYKAGQYAQCLTFINRLQSEKPLETTLLATKANCELAIHDFQGARPDFTAALRSLPMTPAWILGRARCEIAMGSLRDAQTDLALAAAMNPRLPDLEQSQKELSDASAKSETESPATLLASLKQAIAANKSTDEELIALAGRLMRTRSATHYEDAEEYSRELIRLQLAANTDPQNLDKLLALGKFLIAPTVHRKVAIAGVDVIADIPCGESHAAQAAQSLALATKIAPRDPRVMIQQVLYCHALNHLNDMIAWANQAIAAGAADLDVCVTYLQYHTELADQAANQAIFLRTPTYTSSEHREGNKIVTTTTRHDPTPEALAKADELDKQSRQLRIRAIAPLQAFDAKLKDSTATADRVQHQLAIAHEYRWSGKYPLAIKAAQEALALSPYDLDALNFLIDLAPTIQQVELGNQLQDRLNNMINPSPGRTLDQVWPLVRQNNGPAAMAIVERAEKIDSASVAAAADRFAIFDQLGNLEQCLASARLVLVMEEARLRLGGRTLSAQATAPLSAADAGLSVYVRIHLAQKLEQAGQAAPATNLYRGAAATANRTPKSQWSQTLITTALTPNPRDQGTTMNDLATQANQHQPR